MPISISPFVFEGFPNKDWESATPPPLVEAVLSIRKLTEDRFFSIDRLLKKEEEIRKQPHPWISFGTCYKNRVKESQSAAHEVFEEFLPLATANRALINVSPVAWAYAQTDALLRHEFGSAQSLQEFHKIKRWIKEYCDGRDQTELPAIGSEDWAKYLLRDNWRAPLWLRMAASSHFRNDPSALAGLNEQSILHRLDKAETDTLLDGICRWFWSSVKAALENKARLASIDLASRGALRPLTGAMQAEKNPPFAMSEAENLVRQSGEGRVAMDPPELSKGVNEGQTADTLYKQLKRIRSLYRNNGWAPTQIRENTRHDLAVVWEWVDRIKDESHKTEFLRVSDWDDGDGFIFRQIATLYQYAPHLSKKPRWSTIRDWRKAFRGYKQHGTPDGRKPRA